MTHQPGTPPGWYPTSDPQVLRWWDGYQWTLHTSRVPYVAAISSGVDPDQASEGVATRTFASWLIALLPLVVTIAGLPLALMNVSASMILLVLAPLSLALVGANLWCSWWDVSTLRRRGSSIAEVHFLWVLLGAWIYLLVRAIVLKGEDRERWVVMVTSIVVGTLSSLTMFGFLIVSFASNEDMRRTIFYNERGLEREIERAIKDDIGRTPDVDCPSSPPMGKGESFDCEVIEPPDAAVATAVVTWDDHFGGYSWVTQPGSPSPADQA